MAVDNDDWEDVQDTRGFGNGGDIDPSHEGGEYFHFIDMAHDALNGK
jgi:hypothetical protein